MMNETPISTKKCLICKQGRKNDCLHWHHDPESGDIWVYCVGKCQRGYSIYEYCARSGLKLHEFLKLDFEFVEAKKNEVQKMAWPKSFIPLYDPKAAECVEYIRSRGIDVDDGMFYDSSRNGVVFPYYYDTTFCGAQIRLMEPWIDEDGQERKIDTVPGTRLGLLFYGWNQTPFRTNIKAIVVCEGAFNALSIQQSLNEMYGGIVNNPFKCVACSGSGASTHHVEELKALKDQGYRIIAAPDSDDAGLKMLKKLTTAGAITHYALTGNDEVDWNDLLRGTDKKTFGKWFLGRIQSV